MMTLRGSADVGFVLFAGYDIMGLITDLDETTEAMLEQSDGLGAASDEHTAVGITKFDLSFDGFYDDTLIKAIEALSGEQVMMYALSGNVIGRECVGLNAIRSTITRGPSKDALTKAQMAFKSDEGPEVGQVSAPHATVTAQGPVEGASDDWGTQATAVTITSSSVANPTVITTSAPHLLVTGDTVEIAGHSGSTPNINGIHTITVTAPTTFTIDVNVSTGGTGGTMTRTNSRSGGVGYVEADALTLDGGTALQVIIKDSDDDITFVDLITFTAITSAPAAERKTVAGNVERYTLTEHEFTGASGGSRTAKFAAGFVRS
ncbi:MAG: hypothetical protein IIC88_07145 [Chloroflexi bacterium]|nr:hypothetical protein [Chloroflexota bacterium]